MADRLAAHIDQALDHPRHPLDPLPIEAVSRRLDALAAQVRKERAILDFPVRDWVPAARTASGETVLNVLVVGVGQTGVAILLGLARDHVSNILGIDALPQGREGPWLGVARMSTLRTPKEVTGPDLGLPSLSFQAWYEAQFGEAAWISLDLIPRTEWARYLAWVRKVLDLPCRNNVRLDAIKPQGPYLTAEVTTERGSEVLLARKIVLATGVDGGGAWHVPAMVGALPRHLWAHSGEEIDFAGLRGKQVAVLGAAASAMDNAATALEHGAALVEQFCRRSQVQAIQPYKWMSFPGFMRHIGEMDDATRWKFLNYILDLREPFTFDAWSRVSRFANYRMVTGVPWRGLTAEGNKVRIHTHRAPRETDFVICGTGVTVDHRLRPELRHFHDQIATWGDRYRPPQGDENERLALYPYLSPSYAFTERVPGSAPRLADIHCFSFAATLSFGPSGAAIRPMKYMVPKLVRALTRELFRADIEHHWRTLQTFDESEFAGFPRDFGSGE
jgi:cation diffusion facilitator CzcD-associated flavoprotein CzcO